MSPVGQPTRQRHDRDVRLGFLTLAAIVGICLLAFSGTFQRARDALGPQHETITAVFSNTAVLADGAPVRVDGVEVGKVDAVRLRPDGSSAHVEMEVEDNLLPLHEDATASLRWRNVLGGAYYVDLDPGTSAAGQLEEPVIREASTDNQVEMDEMLSTFGRDQREALRTMFDELPKALRNNGAPARALDALADASPEMRTGVRAIRGERPDRDLRDLIVHTDRTVRAFDTPDEAVRRMIEHGAATLTTTARREADIRSMIALSARVLPRIEQTVERLESTFRVADPLLASLQEPTGDIAPSVRQLRPIVVDGNQLLRETRPLLRSLRPASSELAAAARDARPLLEEFEPSLKRADRRIMPDMALPDPTTQRATYQIIGPTFSGLASMAGQYDSISHIARLTLAGVERTVSTAPCRTFVTDPTAEQIAQCQQLVEALERFISYPAARSGGSE